MTKNIIIAAVAILIAFASCNDMDASNMQHIEEMKDTIFKTFPTVGSITIRVEAASILHVTIGDSHFYKADAAAKQAEANRMGLIALRIFEKDTMQDQEKPAILVRIFGKDNKLEKGTLTVTKNERSEEENPADGISTNINLDSLRKSNP